MVHKKNNSIKTSCYNITYCLLTIFGGQCTFKSYFNNILRVLLNGFCFTLFLTIFLWNNKYKNSQKFRYNVFFFTYLRMACNLLFLLFRSKHDTEYLSRLIWWSDLELFSVYRKGKENFLPRERIGLGFLIM